MRYSSPYASPGGASSSAEDQLRHDMEKLQVSTREAMLKSWAEVEQLQQEKESIVERNLELACQLREYQDREEDMKKEIIELKRRLGDAIPGELKGLRAFMARQESKRSNRPKDARSVTSTISAEPSVDTHTMTEHSSESNIEMSGMAFPPQRGLQREGSKRQVLQREGSLRFAWPTVRRDSFMEAEKERLESEFISQINEMEREKAELLMEMKTKVICRDSVLDGMEHAQKVQGETIERLREDMENRDRQAAEREKKVTEQVQSLKKKLKEKRKIIADQQSKIKEFQQYVEELNTRVERSHRLKRGSSIVRNEVPASA